MNERRGCHSTAAEQKAKRFKKMAERRLSLVRSVEKFILKQRKEKYIVISIKQSITFMLFIALSVR